MRKKVFLYRFSGMLFFVCDIENTGIFCSNLAFCNAAKFFSGIFLWYEVPRKDFYGNIRSLLQGKQPQYRLKFDQMLQCDIFGLG